MNKKPFYREQARQFKGCFEKFPNGDLLSLFDEWAESKDIYGRDKHEIWRIARKLKPVQIITINENSEEFVRIDAVLDILLQAYVKRLDRVMEKRKTKGKE